MTPMEQMEAEWACARLSDEFAYSMDGRHYEALAALFTPDGVFDRVGSVLKGREAILAALKNRSPDLRTRHFCANKRFSEVTPTSAKALVYVVNFVGRGDVLGETSKHAMAQAAVLEFRDTYAKTAEGWRIAERVAYTVIMPDEAPHH